MSVPFQPAGYHSVTPYLIVRGAAQALAFYAQAFGAVEILRLPMGELIGHAEIRIGDSVVMLGDEMPNMYNKSPKTVGATTAGVMIYIEDVDALFAQAVAAGATVSMPLADMFWGDRYGQVKDPFGHSWSLATHKEDLSPAEFKKRQDEFFAQMPTEKR